MDIIPEFIVNVITVGGTSAAIAYGIFRFTGQKWLETKFEKSLESYRNTLAKDLERNRYRINTEFNRITKIHEREITVLPEAWIRLQKTVSQLQYFISSGRQYPDLDSLNNDELEEYLSSSNFAESEKNKLKDAKNRLQIYCELIFRRELNDTRHLARVFHSYIRENSIFLNKDMKDIFARIDSIIWKSILHKEFTHQYNYIDIDSERMSLTDVNNKIAPLIEEIETHIQQRLHYEDKLSDD